MSSTLPITDDDMPPLFSADGEPQTHTNGSNVNFANSLSDDEADDDADEVEMPDDDDDNECTTCLFCTEQMTNVDKAMEHLQLKHNVKFPELKMKFSMDQYSFIKLINCIRGGGIDERRVANATEAFWLDDKYLKPAEYEPWLTYDYEALPTPANTNAVTNNNTTAEVVRLRLQVQEQAALLQQASEDMQKMRETFQRLLEKTDAGAEEAENPEEMPRCVATQSLRADESYFGSYAHFGIHHEMLSDAVRTSSYRDALLKNKEYVRGKNVLDVGCGTAVLSIFAAQAGAQRVVGIDNSDIIYQAMDIVKRNNVPNVSLIKGRLEDTPLPQQHYDIIISEWMGYFLLFEGMLDSVIYARDRHLRPGGLLLPNRCTLSLVGYGSDDLFRRHFTFWDDVYGLNMANMRKEVLHEPLVEVVDPQWVLTAPNVVADLDLAVVDLNYSNFTYDFTLECHKAGNLSAFVGYFDTFFDGGGLPQPVHFGTGPHDTPTHWKQVVFFMAEAQRVVAGQRVGGKLSCRRSENNARSLDITIEAFGQKHTYYLD